MQRDETPVEVDPIAIVGTALSFPGATDLTRYWEMLRDGQEAVRFFSEEEMRRAGVKPARLAEPNYVRAKGVIEDAEYFDAALFGMSADRATVMDPQHRLFIQKCWAALDDAGVDPERFGGPIGLFGGCAINTYLLNNLRHADRALTRRFHQIEFLIMTDKDFLTTQTSYLLGLEGPSVTVQTACSTALVAVHYACESLLSGETDLALAGAATVYAPQVKGYLYEEGSIVSDDGHVRSFDAKGRGTVYSSGVAVVVLKRLSDALRDGDRVHAVIRATAVNNDGRRKGGFRMPSAEGMAEAGAQALRLSGVEPARIGMIEANGSATPLGDPIEIAALDRVYGPGAAGPGTIPIGSVKSNIGHMNVTAGMGALLKTVAALRHGKVPPSLNYETPNPQIDFARTPFRVATTLEDWPAIEGPRVAAVNVYGVGGTNAHAILEEAPPVPARAPSPVSEQLLVVSAGSEAALARACADLEAALATDPSLDLDDVAATLERGRRRMTHRRAAVARRDATGAI
ncbi:beta-ketoacyl synthase N-terminal-like domain-containing protein, partial [Salinarimonas rosea]|uniref:beta-ketoacyl synthase N-terminal-like domain-containing protein n=1 Tax=Salinarimonas rosea TaxID=552063 RepID=UPI0005B84B8D